MPLRDLQTITLFVDAVCTELAQLAVALRSGPVDRPWGVRTATFADPAGHLWEVAAPLAG